MQGGGTTIVASAGLCFSAPCNLSQVNSMADPSLLRMPHAFQEPLCELMLRLQRTQGEQEEGSTHIGLVVLEGLRQH